MRTSDEQGDDVAVAEQTASKKRTEIRRKNENETESL
jgi:hypothetical protein